MAPPSGYSPPAVNGHMQIARQCVSDLRQEVADGKHPSLRAGFDTEIAQINAATQAPGVERYRRGSVDFMAGVYEELRSIPGETDPVPAEIEKVLSNIERGLTRLHIENGQFVDRAT